MKYRRYNPTVGAGYDMALIKLKSALDMHRVRPLCVPNSEPQSTSGLLFYWNHETDPTPIMVSVPFTKEIDSLCHNKFQDTYNANIMFCGNPSLCKTNNGAPVVFKYQNKYHIAAMASWSQKCENRGMEYKAVEDAYTKIYYKPYFDWIDETTK